MKPEIQTKFRDYCVDEAVQAGKFPPARRDHYRRLWDADPEGTRQLIDSLEGVLPVSEIGAAGAVEAAGPTDYPKEWLGREAETVGTDTAARPTVMSAKD